MGFLYHPDPGRETDQQLGGRFSGASQDEGTKETEPLWQSLLLVFFTYILQFLHIGPKYDRFLVFAYFCILFLSLFFILCI